jgi:fructose-1-phosphate kinase PfkB-like protein
VIVVVCLNPALDITHHVPKVDWAGVNRPTAVHARPGGKGTNVARALQSFGLRPVLMGFTGGTTGAAVAAALAHGLVAGRSWEDRLRHAAALGAATAAAPVAGEFRRQDYLGALTAVTVEEVR